jgi:hypothetical protein
MRRMPDICFWVGLAFAISHSCFYRIADLHISKQIDIVDYNEPTMLIVGSRGMSQLKGCVFVLCALVVHFSHSLK